jgi:hypothetical protein
MYRSKSITRQRNVTQKTALSLLVQIVDRVFHFDLKSFGEERMKCLALDGENLNLLRCVCGHTYRPCIHMV